MRTRYLLILLTILAACSSPESPTEQTTVRVPKVQLTQAPTPVPEPLFGGFTQAEWLRAMSDQDPDTNRKVARKLIPMGETALPVLVAALETDHSRIRYSALWTISENGDTFSAEAQATLVPLATACLKDPNWGTRLFAVTVLRELGVEPNVDINRLP